MVIPLLLVVSIGRPSTVHETFGEFIKPLTVDTLQVIEYISPARAMPDLSILTWTALLGTVRMYRNDH